MTRSVLQKVETAIVSGQWDRRCGNNMATDEWGFDDQLMRKFVGIWNISWFPCLQGILKPNAAQEFREQNAVISAKAFEASLAANKMAQVCAQPNMAMPALQSCIAFATEDAVTPFDGKSPEQSSHHRRDVSKSPEDLSRMASLYCWLHPTSPLCQQGY